MTQRGDMNVLSLVLIAGIVIALVVAAYTWSNGLIQKGEARTLYQTASSYALKLNDEVIDLANSGGGEKTITIPFGAVEVYPANAIDARNNSIIFRFVISQPLSLNSSRTYLGGASFIDVVNTTTGIFGESSPSIITLDVAPISGAQYQAAIQIHFRPLLSKTTGLKRAIVLNYGNGQVLSGTGKVTLAFQEQIQDPNDADTSLTIIKAFVV